MTTDEWRKPPALSYHFAHKRSHLLLNGSSCLIAEYMIDKQSCRVGGEIAIKKNVRTLHFMTFFQERREQRRRAESRASVEEASERRGRSPGRKS